MRQRDQLNPDEMRELDALDRVLAGEPVDADLRELEDLVLDIRATAPEMTPGFAARLEHEVSERFPTQAATSGPVRRRRWMLVPAAGTVAAVGLALVAIVGPSGPTDMAATPASREAAGAVQDTAPAPTADRAAADELQMDSEAPVERAARAPKRLKSSTAPPPGAPPPPPALNAPVPQSGSSGSSSSATATAAPADTRKVERNALLVLEAPDGKLDSTADAVIRTVDRFGGIVQTSSIGSADGSSGEATFDLRIPTDKLDDALAALSKLGHVAERSQNLQDITGSFTSAQDRLADARAERRGLLKALGKASTQQQIDSLRARLRLVRSQIARLNGQLDSLRRRADLSTVQLTVRGTGTSEEGTGGGGEWTPGDAANDAVRILEVIAGVALIALAIAVPLGLVGVAIMLGVRVGRRRRREGALDAV